MSRLAKKPLPIPAGVTVSVDASFVAVKGAKGEKKVVLLSGILIDQKEGSLWVKGTDEKKQTRANVGTMWSLLRNALIGVSEGFSKNLEIQGVGFRAAMEGKTLVLSLGYVNPVRIESAAGVDIVVEKNIIKVSGYDKDAVGLAASKIRALKKPEPYKGKGIRYEGEVVKLKAGKKAATA